MAGKPDLEPDWAVLDGIQEETRRHRERHGCGAYTFEDGPGLVAIARRCRARRALELGTALGYTACCLASSSDEARVDTIERDPEHVALARVNVGKAGLADRVAVHEGEFGAVLARLRGPYDLAFFDGFAPDAAIVARLRDLLRPNGTLVCANLWFLSAAERRALMSELGSADRWRRAGSIEEGATEVYMRLP